MCDNCYKKFINKYCILIADMYMYKDVKYCINKFLQILTNYIFLLDAVMHIL